jgi:hypothetical protein
MSENPEDWRSVVDAGSGRTYWYHRKTRESTWIRPDFIEVNVAVDRTDVAKEKNSDKSDKTDKHLNKSTNLNSSIDSLLTLLQKLTVNPATGTAQDHQFILTIIVGEVFTMFEHAESVIDGLVNVIVASSTKSGDRIALSSMKVTRHLALRCLYALSVSGKRSFSARCFYEYRSWMSIITLVPRWSSNKSGSGPGGLHSGDADNNYSIDPESLLLLTALYCSLLVGPTYNLINEESKTDLIALLDSMFISNSEIAVNFEVLSSLSLPLLDDFTVQTFSFLAERGHRLPAVWLLSVFTQSFRY